jgi:CubicO group peptidase (beta-lactamase class C family)
MRSDDESSGTSGLRSTLRVELQSLVDAGLLPGLHGVVAVRSGDLVAELYGSGDDYSWGQQLGHVDFDESTLHDLRSVTKSIVTLLYGIALDRELVPRPQDELMASFPEFADLASDAARREITIEHVLTMTMGTLWEESLPYTSSANSEIAMELAPDRYRFVLERPMVAVPGERWCYNGGAIALIGRLIERGTGLSLSEFAANTLFAALGIRNFGWLIGSDGSPSAASGLRLCPRDLATIGQFVLHHGRWNDENVVSVDWVNAMTKPRYVVDPARNYGYGWYRNATPTAAGSADWIAAMGNGGQRLWIVPSLELVVVTTFGNYDAADQSVAPELVFRTILTAVRGR